MLYDAQQVGRVGRGPGGLGRLAQRVKVGEGAGDAAADEGTVRFEVGANDAVAGSVEEARECQAFGHADASNKDSLARLGRDMVARPSWKEFLKEIGRDEDKSV